jgi:uncharacterized protein YqgC (DUF456 family)
MPEWLNTSITVIALIFMLVGWVGLIIPVYPGLVIIWLAALGYGILSGFSTLGIVMIVVMAVLMILGGVVDNLLMGVGARQTGAPWLSIILAMVAGIIATFLFPPVGGLIAAPALLYLLEWRRLGNSAEAVQSLKGLAKGWGLAYLARFGIGFLMIVLWGIWVWQG